MTGYLTFDIGCIECGESSSVVGVYDTREQAEMAQRERAEGDADGSYFSGGQHRVEVFEL